MPLTPAHQPLIAELAETAMAMSRDIAAAALAARAVEEKIALATAYEKLARSVRLSVALAAKLEREERAEARRARAAAEAGMSPELRALTSRIEQRKAVVGEAARRAIERDCEGEDAEVLEQALGDVLEELALLPRFASAPLSDLAAEVRRLLRLPETLAVSLPDDIRRARAGGAPARAAALAGPS